MRKLSSIQMMHGLLLLASDDNDSHDASAGIAIQNEKLDQAIGIVVKGGVNIDAPYMAGCSTLPVVQIIRAGQAVIYRRVVAQAIHLTDEDGREKEYKIVHEDDVTAYFEEDEDQGRA